MSELHKFIFDGLPIRGQFVRLTGAWQTVLERRAANTQTGAWPANVSTALGEMTAAAVMLQAGIKFDGRLSMQIAGDGPVSLMVAEVDSQLRLRSTVSLAEQPSGDETLPGLVNAGGSGRCAITLDPDSARRQSYQGIVPLVDESGRKLPRIAPMIESYMMQSEQLETTLVLAAGSQAAAGLMLQKMPRDGTLKAGDEDFSRLSILARSLKNQELLELDTETLLHRLFWNEPLLRFTGPEHERVPSFHCQCSRERVTAMLQGLGKDEVDDILRDRGEVEVGCEFCGRQERFDKVDIAQLFQSGSQHSPPDNIQ